MSDVAVLPRERMPARPVAGAAGRGARTHSVTMDEWRR
jgi:hypothetical protein